MNVDTRMGFLGGLVSSSPSPVHEGAPPPWLGSALVLTPWLRSDPPDVIMPDGGVTFLQILRQAKKHKDMRWFW